jgi:ZIP family zinc transporter
MAHLDRRRRFSRLIAVGIWSAFFWGAFSSAALFIGAATARRMEPHRRATGQLMGFGAGTMLSAVAYELIPETSFERGVALGVSVMIGAFAYYIGDRLVDKGGGASRQDLDAAAGSQGSGAAMFIGALLDGVPEAFILGITLAVGGAISVAFVTSVFISNVPQGNAGTTSLRAAGYSDRTIYRMWALLMLATALTAVAGFIVGDSVPSNGIYAEGFAAGAVLTMLADSMMPEAFEHGGRSVGLLTVLGFLFAGALSVKG